jgi:hypothetical protein
MTKTNAKTITVSKSDLATMIAQAVAAALSNGMKPVATGSAKPIPNTLVDGKTERQLKIDVAVCRAFKKAGFGNVVPREDVMTYNRWMANGFKVKPGEKSVKVKQFRLFHKSQVEFVGAPNKEDLQAEANAANLAHKVAQEQRISA